MLERLDVVEQVVGCTACELYAQCRAPVPFRGSTARIAVVGEAPGEQEDQQGKPFVGPSGQFITGLLADVGLTEELAYCNTVSCLPHGTPTWEHIHACDHNKWTQLDHINPTYVLLLGRVALKATRPDLDIKRGRGRPFAHRDRVHYATYHPAAALRKSSYVDSMRDDLVRFKEMVDAGVDEWYRFIPDSCAACPIEPAWIDDSGLGWCPVDMPSDVRKRYEARRAQVEADLQATKDRRRAEARTAAGLAAVEANADPVWMAQAWAVLVGYLESHEQFFVDDFWNDTQLPRPRESRALGPLVQRAAREGLMEKTGRFRKSVASNLTEKPVWLSRICRKLNV